MNLLLAKLPSCFISNSLKTKIKSVPKLLSIPNEANSEIVYVLQKTAVTISKTKSNNNFMNTILSNEIFKTLYAKKQLVIPINVWVIIAAYAAPKAWYFGINQRFKPIFVINAMNAKIFNIFSEPFAVSNEPKIYIKQSGIKHNITQPKTCVA